MSKLQHPHTLARIRSNSGFSLFELVVYILVVAIVFSVAARRFQDFPGEAERANFLAINGQLKAAVNLQMMNAIARGEWQQLGPLENSNPMALMLETPSNYIGEFNLVDEASMPRRTWYFDSFNGQLVYLANDTRQLFSTLGDGTSTLSSIRFRIAMRYAGDAAQGPEGLGIDVATVTGLKDSLQRTGGAASQERQWQGLVLEPVTPYRWERTAIALPSGQ